MTAAQLRDLIVSAEFKQDVEQLSSYLASIAPETPIKHCLAKHLWKGGHKFQLEAKRKDLVVNGKHVEFKGTFDFSMTGLERELVSYGEKPLKAMYWAARMMKKSIGWSGLNIYQDICEKKPDIFVLIICSRLEQD